MISVGLHIRGIFIFNAAILTLTPFIRGPGNYLAFTLIFLSTNLLIVSFLWQAIKTGTMKIVLSPLSAISFLFLGIIFISYFFTINPPSTRYGFFTMASVIINGAFLSFVRPGERLWKGLCFVLVITLSFLCVMALYQYITGHSNFAGRAHATFVNPNSFSGYLLLTIGLLAILFLFLIPLGNNKDSFSPKPAEISGSTQDRLNIWKSTLEVIKEHPIRGVGFWSFHTIYSKYKNRIYKNVEHYFSHNDYLQLWAELGLMGAGVFLLLILFYFREGLR